MREAERQRERQRGREGERERERQRGRKRERIRETDRQRERKGQEVREVRSNVSYLDHLIACRTKKKVLSRTI